MNKRSRYTRNETNQTEAKASLVFATGTHGALVLAGHGVLDGVEHVGDGSFGAVTGLGAGLEDASMDEDRVPVGGSVRVVVVGAADVRLGCVADKIDRVGRRVDLVSVAAPLLQQPRGKVERANLRLPKRRRVERLARDGREHCLERDAQRAHADARQVMPRAPHDVVMREEDGRALVKMRRPRSQPAALRHEQVKDDLLVARPVAAVSKDENGLDLDLIEVASARVGPLLSRQLAERRRVRVILDNVAWCHHVAEAVALSHVSTFFTLAAHDEHRVVLLGHLPHRCVPANELAG